MAKSTRDTTKTMDRKRKPAPGTPIMTRLQPNELAALDAWIATQDDPKQTRAEALRQLARKGPGKGKQLVARTRSVQENARDARTAQALQLSGDFIGRTKKGRLLAGLAGIRKADHARFVVAGRGLRQTGHSSRCRKTALDGARLVGCVSRHIESARDCHRHRIQGSAALFKLGLDEI